MKLINGECLAEMAKMPDKSVDLLICDLPYGETNCSWDSVIDMEEFWKEFKRIRKSKRTACIHFCSTKFGYSLIKSWEKGYKMDMVWKKRNKTGGLQSRHRPMRNHEMVYFFYEQAPKYNRDKYHKRINNVKHAKSETTNEKKTDKVENVIIERKPANFEPSNPASVLEEKTIYNIDKDKTHPNGDRRFLPPNPASVIEEHESINYKTTSNEIHERTKAYMSGNKNLFEPRLPASVIEETERKSVKDRKGLITKSDLYPKENQTTSHFEPPNPASVLEEKYTKEYLDNKQKAVGTGGSEMQGIFTKENIKKFQKENGGFEPPNPASVLDEEEDPVSMFESKKVFIGKRNHQTEKPQDILEFFLKYWSDEGDVILDPTMGSGSTGVACKKMGREFIGIELTEKYFNVAKERIDGI